MTATYTTRTEAIDREIVEPIEAGDATAAGFDIEAIADQVLTTTGEGVDYRWTLRDDIDEDTFWGIVADNAR